MRFDIVTLFPDLFGPHLSQGITRRAFDGGQVGVHLWPLRDFATDTYRRVDDRPFGGGPGMVMLAEPLERALAAVQAARAAAQVPAAPVIHFTPTGAPITQELVRQMAAADASPEAAERLIPFVAAYIDAVSLADQRITVDWGLDY